MMPTLSLQPIIAALHTAHAASALRHNLSHDALILATIGSGSYTQAIAAALMTLGGIHAPLVETCLLLQQERPEEWAAEALANGIKVPGWGNGFVKDGLDPDWEDLDALLRETAPDLMRKVDAVTTVLHDAGKMIYPNPSCYTAVVALLTGVPPHASPSLFVAARLPKWTEEYCRIKGGGR